MTRVKLILTFSLYFICSQIGGIECKNVRNKSDSFGTKLNSLGTKSDFSEFDDMNDDCKLLVLEELDIINLFEMAEVNVGFRALVITVLKRKLAGKVIRIRRALPGDGRIYETSSVVDVFDLVLARKLIDYAGLLISKLTVNYWNFSDEQVQDLSKMINQRCTSLTELRISDFNQSSLLAIEQPFYHVEKVVLHGTYLSLTRKTLRLNEIFPKMRSLTLMQLYLFSNDSIHMHFPNLVELEFSFFRIFQAMQSELEDMIKLNPQVKSISIHEYSKSFLKFINENLPHLEDLKLDGLHVIDHLQRINDHQSQDAINFTTVKNLTVTTMPPVSMALLNFPKLQEFNLISSSGDIHGWINFIRRHDQLRILRTKGYTISDIISATFIESVPNLIEASFDTLGKVQIEKIAIFLKKTTHLEKLHLQINSIVSESELNQFQDRIKNQWHVRQQANHLTITNKM